MVRKIFFKPSEFTPGILFDPEINIFRMWGNSRPEDLSEFYFPILEWIDSFLNDLNNNKKKYESLSELVLEIEMEYFNSASSKMIFDIIQRFKDVEKNNIKYIINWIYFSDDEDIYESATELETELMLSFKYTVKERENK